MTGPSDIGEPAYDHGEPHVRSIYNGKDWLGDVNVGRSIRATRPDGSEIGVYTSVEEARAAIVRDALGGRRP